MKSLKKWDCPGLRPLLQKQRVLYSKPGIIERISKSLRMKIGAFSQKYLKMDDEGDWVLQKSPCSFLDEATNSCTIYDVRPQACVEYPHTDRKQMSGILAITEENAPRLPSGVKHGSKNSRGGRRQKNNLVFL